MPPKAAVARPAAKKKAPIHKLPDPIRDGEIVRDIQKREWRLGKSIGVGGFGEIYAASDKIDKPVSAADAQYVIKIEPHSNGPLFVEMNFYMRVAKADLIDEWITSRKLKFLGMPRFIGSGSHLYKGEKYRFMVMQRFGTDVQKLFDANQRHFPLNTILNLAMRIIDVLEYIHAKQYVHADIKGSNLLLGFGKGGENQVWLVDFGLACRYIIDGVHKEYRPDLRKAHNGTIEFTSRDAHIGANGRRGDFEILGYNMLQWMCGRLPWESNLTDPEYVASQKNKYMSDIPLLINACFPAKNAPAVMGKFLEMVAQLKFDEKPNYDKFRQLLRQGLKDGGFPDNGVLVFPNMNKRPISIARISPKKRSVPATPLDDEAENSPVKQKAKTSIKKSREPCSPKLTNRTTRRANLSPDCDTTDSSSLSGTMLGVVPKKRSAEKKGLPKDSPAKLDTSLCNPTPAMLAILARMRSKEETAAAAIPSKRKQARLDSRSCSPIDLDSSSILTPAMEEVIRVREVRKSMEQSGHFFTPICSPMTESANSAASGGHFPFPSSTPRNLDLYMTLDCTPEEEPRRKKSDGSGGGKASSTRKSPRTQVTRNKHQDSVILDDSMASSVNSSTAGDSSTSVTPDNNKRRVVFRRNKETVEMTSAATQTSPGVLKLPTIQRSRYALRSAQSPLSTPGGFRPPPQVIELSPDMFRDGSP